MFTARLKSRRFKTDSFQIDATPKNAFVDPMVALRDE